MPKVIPVISPDINWDSYIRAYKSVFNESPTRCLDSSGIQLNRPCAFTSILDFKDQPRSILANSTGLAFDLTSFGFITGMGEEALITVSTQSRLHIASKRSEMGYFVILYGSLTEWRDAVINICTGLFVFEAREVMCSCLGYLESYGFKSLWKDYDKLNMELDVFTLRKKK